MDVTGRTQLQQGISTLPPGADRRRRHGSAPSLDPAGASPQRWSTRARILRVSPFAAVAILAECSGLLPPGPRNLAEYLSSVGVLSVGALIVGIGIPRDRRLTRVAGLLLALASWTLLTLAEGGPGNGLLVVALVPVMWAASFEEPWVACLTLLAMCAAVAVEMILDPGPTAVDIRRLAFVMIVAVFSTASVHATRRHLVATIAERDELLRGSGLLEAADRELLEMRLPADVLAAACRIAGRIASPPGAAGRRATYLRVANGVVRIDAGTDSDEKLPAMTWPLVDHPYLSTVLLRHKPMAGALYPELLGPTLREYARATGVTHGAWIPVAPNGTLDGVLAVMGKGAPVSDHVLGELTGLGRVLALALANAYTNERVEEEALTDPLTGLLNRRGLTRSLAERTRGRQVAVLSLDVDGLKWVNDSAGHAAGDALICAVAQALSTSVRAEDILARVGGDEFVACLVGATAATADSAASRVFAQLGSAESSGFTPRVSVGIAIGGPLDGFDTIAPLADTAMYVAKQHGGNQVQVWRPVDITVT
jgi:diguanylate cyclase (GGDEF)-like protein